MLFQREKPIFIMLCSVCLNAAVEIKNLIACRDKFIFIKYSLAKRNGCINEMWLFKVKPIFTHSFISKFGSNHQRCGTNWMTSLFVTSIPVSCKMYN